MREPRGSERGRHWSLKVNETHPRRETRMTFNVFWKTFVLHGTGAQALHGGNGPS